MDATVTDPAARVCPRCGEEAGEQRFCGGCGLNLSAQNELPTRSEWEKAHVAPTEDALSSVPMRANDGEHRDTPPLPRQKQSGRGFRSWYDKQSKGGKVAFILSTTVAVILVLGVIGAASGGNSNASTTSSTGTTSSQASPPTAVETAVDKDVLSQAKSYYSGQGITAAHCEKTGFGVEVNYYSCTLTDAEGETEPHKWEVYGGGDAVPASE